MCEGFADIGWSGTAVTVMPGQVTTSRRRFDDTFLELGDIAPGLFLGDLAVYLTSMAVRAQGIMTAPAYHLNRWDIPSEAPLSLPELTTMRKAAKKSRG